MAVWPGWVNRRRGDSPRLRPLSLLPLPRRRRLVDPFAALRVQCALTRLESEIETVRRDDARFAQAHHLRAATTAYGGVLAEACRLAGVPVEGEQFGAVSRLQAEADLQARGWTW